MKFERIKNLRQDYDFSQQEVARRLKLTRSTYSNYENNIRNIPIEVLSNIADLYGTSVDYLIGRTDEIISYPKKQD